MCVIAAECWGTVPALLAAAKTVRRLTDGDYYQDEEETVKTKPYTTSQDA